MRAVHNARLVPDHVPAGLATKVIKLSDIGVPIEVALGRFEAVLDEQLEELRDTIARELEIREALRDPC